MTLTTNDNKEKKNQKIKRGSVQTKGRSADKMLLKTGLRGRLAIGKRTGGASEKKTSNNNKEKKKEKAASCYN